MREKWSGAYTFGEARTGHGQLVEFTCRPEDSEKIAEFLKQVRSINIPTTGRISVPHGGYGRYTRYDIVQHKYAGGGDGYIEALEIRNPPDGRCGYVIHEYHGCSGSGSVFYEFRKCEQAIAAWGKYWGSPDRPDNLLKCKGLIRRVVCNYAMDPWFYAVGDQLLMGDFVFPDVIEEDATYRFGKKYVVRDRDETPMIKTCVGMRWVERGGGIYGDKKTRHRQVFFDDGTTWDEYSMKPPELLTESKLWIGAAIDQLRRLLAGRTDKFEIPFTDGGKFIGRFIPPKGSKVIAGIYEVKGLFQKGEITKEFSGPFNFQPTTKAPTVEESLRLVAADQGGTITAIHSIKFMKRSRGGRLVFAGYYDRDQ